MIVRDEMIGGATVMRGYSGPDGFVRAGTTLTRNDVLAMPARNRQALIDTGKLAVFPPDPARGELHLVSRGFGKFDVIEGRVLNVDGPLSKEEAEELVARVRAARGETEEPEAPPATN